MGSSGGSSGGGGGPGSDTTAVHDNVDGEIAAITEKASPVSADLVLLEDSAASNAKKYAQVGNLPGGGGGGSPEVVNNEPGTAITLAAGDAGKTTETTNALAKTVTLPANASVAISTREWFAFRNGGAGALTIEGAAGVDVNGTTAGSVVIPQYGEAIATKTDTDVWNVVGSVDDVTLGGDLSGDLDAAVVTGVRGVNVDNADLDYDRAYVYNDSDLVAKGVSCVQHVDVGASAISNTASETSLLDSTFDIPANTLKVGDIIHASVFGEVTNNKGTNGTVTNRLKADGGNLGSVGSVALSSNANARWFEASWTVIITTIGASGTCKVVSRQSVSEVFSLGNDTSNKMTATIGVSLDTTQALTIDITEQMSAADANFEVDCYGAEIHKHAA